VPDDDAWIAVLSPDGRLQAEAAASKRLRAGLVALVDAWAASVRRLGESDNEDYYDDYFGYVSWRPALDEVMTVLSGDDLRIVRSVLEPIDRQFEALTADDAGRALSSLYSVDLNRWYWRRVPREGPIARSIRRRQAWLDDRT
jgi:hypothetical protein